MVRRPSAVAADRAGVRFSAELLRQIRQRDIGGRQRIEPILSVVLWAFTDREPHSSDTIELSAQRQIAARLFVLVRLCPLRRG